MKKANISEIKNQLSYFLNFVRKGESIRIFDRSLPIADIVPIQKLNKREVGEKYYALAEKGVIALRNKPLPSHFVEELETMEKKWNREDQFGFLEALLEERKDSR